MLCARELVSLLVNLFPTSTWETCDPDLIPKEVIEDFDSLRNAIKLTEFKKFRGSLVYPQNTAKELR